MGNSHTAAVVGIGLLLIVVVSLQQLR